MAIRFACRACGKFYSQPESSAGKKARCKCGTVFTVPQSEPAEADEGLYDLMPDEPVQRLPHGAQRVFEAPAAHAGGFSRESAPAHAGYTPQQSSSKKSSRVAAPGASHAARTDRSGSDSKSMLAKIGGGIMTVLLLLGVVAKIARIYMRSGDDDTQTVAQQELSERESMAREMERRATAEPPAVTRIAPPPRVELVSRGAYQSARIDVTNCTGTVTHLEVMLPPGKHDRASLPCVFVAPAGSTLLTGNALEDNYTDESLPYVEAGFACVRYSLSGALASDNPSDMEFFNAYVAFRNSHGGVSDASAAIDTVVADYPEIDPSRLFVAGHSSAANAALLVAQKDTRIKACVAYAPAVDVRARFEPGWSELSQMPGIDSFIRDTSPKAQGTPRTPVLLFHARDDSNVPVGQSEAFANEHRGRVKFVTVPSGDHYDSMIREGIPAGIKYLTSEHGASTRG